MWLQRHLRLGAKQPLIELVKVSQTIVELALADKHPHKAEDEKDEEEVFHGVCR